MCGIGGIWVRGADPWLDLEATARAMAAVLRHRGPDASGTWVDAGARLALAHTRLSIIDVGPGGAQPMVSADGRFVISYNGEVYETDVMRSELEARGVKFRGHSDTEVILEACAAWGVDAVLPRLVGMFAFGLWDRTRRSLTLVRDRFGIKPLYWRDGALALFGSELKALLATPGWLPEIDREALAAYLRFAYVPTPRSIWRGIHKLPPGCMAVLPAEGGPARVTRWWDLRPLVKLGLEQPSDIGLDEAIEELDRLLRRVVGSRMVADVPLGAFLSGGIDSSTVVAQMQAQSARPVQTFTIGLAERGYDESAAARAVARHLGTDHQELLVTPEEARAVIPSLPEWYDEPFADPSQIPTYLVSRLTRRRVTVALSGDGGDELFAGYNRYSWGEQLWRRLDRMPRPLRTAAAGGLGLVSPAIWRRLEAVPGAPRLLEMKAIKLRAVLALQDQAGFYRRLVSWWTQPEHLVGVAGEEGPLWDEGLVCDLPAPLERMQYLDAITYLPDDILTKIDRASMAVSLEARVPLLDHRVAAFAFGLPRALRCSGVTGKVLLRWVLQRYVPPALFERSKMGFGIPIGAWLRGPLRDWAEELLAESALATTGLMPGPVREAWCQHLSGRRNRETELWIVLMYQAWYRRWVCR
jgi:asparagine synthase (glutamine-hydrolysing)